MRLYHYAPKKNTVLKQGLCSFSKYLGNLKSYAFFAKSNKKKDIIAWMDKVFPGRSRSISCFTEPVKWRGNNRVLKKIVKNTVLFSFELDDLIKAGLVESVWCRDDVAKKGHKYVLDDGYEQYFYKVKPKEIDTSSLPWEKVKNNNRAGLLRHYMIVMKKGVIPPKYLRLEKKDFGFVFYLSRLLEKLFTRKK